MFYCVVFFFWVWEFGIGKFRDYLISAEVVNVEGYYDEDWLGYYGSYVI